MGMAYLLGGWQLIASRREDRRPISSMFDISPPTDCSRREQPGGYGPLSTSGSGDRCIFSREGCIFRMYLPLHGYGP